jgi:hypothetical protein
VATSNEEGRNIMDRLKIAVEYDGKKHSETPRGADLQFGGSIEVKYPSEMYNLLNDAFFSNKNIIVKTGENTNVCRVIESCNQDREVEISVTYKLSGIEE